MTYEHRYISEQTLMMHLPDRLNAWSNEGWETFAVQEDSNSWIFWQRRKLKDDRAELLAEIDLLRSQLENAACQIDAYKGIIQKMHDAKQKVLTIESKETKKPTIEELNAILNGSKGEYFTMIRPDGSIYAQRKPIIQPIMTMEEAIAQANAEEGIKPTIGELEENNAREVINATSSSYVVARTSEQITSNSMKIDSVLETVKNHKILGEVGQIQK